MRWQPVTYNGSTIHGTAYAAYSGAGAMDLLNLPVSDAQFISRGLNTYSAYSGAVYRPREFSIIFERKGTGGSAPTPAQFGDMLETLKGLFYPPSEGTLTVWDIDDSNKPYTIRCVPVESPVISYREAEFRFVAADPRFYSAAGTTSANLTSSPGTITVTVSGNVNSQPIIKITPTGAKSGDYAYKLPVVTYNQAGTALSVYPVDLATDSGTGVWSTTAAVSGGTIQADGDDLRVMLGGMENDRWLQGMNSGTTRVWTNLSYAPYTALYLQAAVSASGTPSTIHFKHTAASLAALKRMPAAGEMYNPGTGERLTYSAISLANYTITPQYRGIKGSTAGTIPASGTLIWLDNPNVWFYYGNASAEAPVTDDTKKPMFDLTSTNSSWVYSVFYDTTCQRPAAWQPAVVVATSPAPTSITSQTYRQTRTYTGDQGGTADPAVEMGISIAAWQKGGIWRAEDAVVEWRLTNPCGFTTMTVTGTKYRVTSSWPDVMGLQVSTTGRTWATIWDEASPGTASVYTNLTANGSAYSLGGTFPAVRIVGDGAVSAGSGNLAAIEISDATAAIAAPPVVKRGTQQNNYFLNCTILNTTTGKGFTLSGLVALNQTITIDCAAQTITYGLDGTDMQAGLVLDSARAEWLDLVPGANVITYTDTGMGNLTLAFLTQDEMV